MRVCLIFEGSYPYSFGGVSSWAHNYIKAMPDIEFVLWVIGAKAESRGVFKYELPENVAEVHEVFLDDALKVTSDGKNRYKLSEQEMNAVTKLIDCDRPDWDVLFSMFQDREYNPMSFLMSDSFLDVLMELCNEKYPYMAFSETFHTLRSMLLPVLYLMGAEVPKADEYHTICTGYGGLLGRLGHYKTGKPLILTEHGIYSREREEEIIRANWVNPSFKRHWIRFFYMLSDAVYSRAKFVTSLFGNARKAQIDLGADPDRCRVIPNGIHFKNFCDIPLKEDDGMVDIGAVIRLAQIKDVKTLIYAYYELCSKRSNVRLHILGGVDDEEYARECYDLADRLELDNLKFAGQVNVIEYMKQLDFTVLTSISEGQPLSVLESFAAGRPVVTTDVGCCRQLIDGEEEDRLGTAGFCVPPMHRQALTKALDTMCENRDKRVEMGEVGKARAGKYFQHPMMIKRYRSLYEEA